MTTRNNSWVLELLYILMWITKCHSTDLHYAPTLCLRSLTHDSSGIKDLAPVQLTHSRYSCGVNQSHPKTRLNRNMAFKFVTLIATMAVATQAASMWPQRSNQNQQEQWNRLQSSGGSSSGAVSTNWMWDENANRRIQEQDQQRRWDDQQQWQQMQGRDQDRDQGQWNGNMRNWDSSNRNRNNNNGVDGNWNQGERQQWQQQNWDRNWDESNDDHPRYEFGYEVRDPRTGDFKAHQERRDGHNVRGQYSMLESDGTRRVVDYSSDSRNGFNANVRKEGWSRHD